jgi:hypothetical protein
MPDYYSLLIQKISEAKTDPGKLRELVYEAARLALRRHVNVHYPALSLQDGKRLLADLEAAIERLEAETGGTVRRPTVAQGEDKAAPASAANQNGRAPGPAPPEFDFRPTFGGKPDPINRPADAIAGAPPSPIAPDTSDQPPSWMRGGRATGSGLPPRADERPSASSRSGGGPIWALSNRPGARAGDRAVDNIRPTVGPTPPQDGAALLDWPLAQGHDEPDSRNLVLVAQDNPVANRGAAYLARPDISASRPRDSFWAAAKPWIIANRHLLIGAGIATQVAVVILAGTALYVTVSRRPAPPPTVLDITASAPVAPRGKVPQAKRPATVSGPAAEPLSTASFGAAAPAAPASATSASSRPFPRPSAYGVYAISNNRLIELEQVTATPVDPRARNSLQIVKPSRTVIRDPRLSFIAYRRDMTTNAPDKVSVRIAARIARAMTVDPLGKAVMEPPAIESWLIRDLGYDLRVSPMPESTEMVLLQPETNDFAFPSGRYVLVLGGQSYDFVIAGVVMESSQCVEGIATARGPAFYECRTQ